MSVIQGIFNTKGLGTTQNLTALSFDRMITRLMPNGTAPLFALTSYLNSEIAVQVEHGFFAKSALFPYVVLSAAATNSATTLTVDSTENIIEGMILQLNNTTKENVLVTAVTSDTTIQVQRAVGGTAGTAAIGDAAAGLGDRRLAGGAAVRLAGLRGHLAVGADELRRTLRADAPPSGRGEVRTRPAAPQLERIPPGVELAPDQPATPFRSSLQARPPLSAVAEL